MHDADPEPLKIDPPEPEPSGRRGGPREHRQFTVALDTLLDEALKREGVLREALHAIPQTRQTTQGLEVSHRIHLTVKERRHYEEI